MENKKVVIVDSLEEAKKEAHKTGYPVFICTVFAFKPEKKLLKNEDDLARVFEDFINLSPTWQVALEPTLEEGQ